MADKKKRQCSADIRTPGMWSSYHKCENYGTFIEDGKFWCKIHAPSQTKAKRDIRQAAYDHDCKLRDQQRAIEAIEREIVKAVVEVCGPAALVELRDKHIAAVAAMERIKHGDA